MGPTVDLLGRSEAMRRIRATLEKVARYRTTVLLLGESGTGKDLIARTLHELGPGRTARYEPQNCASLNSELLENELFGHERGAFTGANVRKPGIFELANGGTLFLDEIGEMELTTQAKLLRVLDQRRFRRVGGVEAIAVDMNVVAATNRDLPQLVEAGRFRADLYYRLRVVHIEVPPLRERKEDIPDLAARFVEQFNARHGVKLKGIDPGLMRRFLAYDWPGNVRELRNAVESAAVFAMGSTLTEHDADESGFLDVVAHGGAPLPPEAGVGSLPSLEQVERQLIEARIKQLGSREAAARSLGIGVRTLYAKLARYEREGPA